ncbi:MAG TPA: 3-methyl-2-oxobutanoate hydroxymethyltransferase [Gemmatimonadaceae bacterium]|nr:3-methyl-2-oxobutanoate hydroxymethyltransferase [Gemmatimonadaceae bacterium]
MATSEEKKVTLATLQARRRDGTRVSFVTAYDYPTACFADRAGVDMILVGDSAAMTVLGHSSTIHITMDEMLVFAGAVCRGAKRAFVIGDMPFLSYQPSDERAILSAGAFIRAGCDAVKCEGGQRVAGRVKAMVDAGIAVMGHLGLTPQNLVQLGGYRVQGKSVAAAQRVVDDALALQEAGAFGVLLEAMPAEAAAYVRDSVDMLVYGIGAGPHLDGQLVISHDILGTFVGSISPRFVRRYAELGTETERVFREYAADVREGRFPSPELCYPIDADEEAALRRRRAALAGASRRRPSSTWRAPAERAAGKSKRRRD